MKEENKKFIYLGLFLSVCISWGFCFILLDKLIGDYNTPVFFVVALRFIIGTAFVAVMRPILRCPKITKQELIKGAYTGIVLFSAFAAQAFGAKYTTPAKNGMLTGVYVIFVPLLLMIIKRKLNFKAIFDAVICIVGFVILYKLYEGIDNVNIGDLLTLLGAALFATQFILLERNTPSLNTVNYCFIQLAVVAVVASVLSLATEVKSYATITEWGNVIGGLFFLGIMGAGYAYLIQNFVQSKMKATTVSVVSCSEAVFAVTFSLIFGLEAPSLNLLIGALIIFASILSANLLTDDSLKRIMLKSRQKNIVSTPESSDEDKG